MSEFDEESMFWKSLSKERRGLLKADFKFFKRTASKLDRICDKLSSYDRQEISEPTKELMQEISQKANKAQDIAEGWYKF